MAVAPTAIVQLFCNAASGSYSAAGIASLVAALEALGATVRVTQSIDREPAIAADTTHVCIAAGDGTVRHVAAAVSRSGRTPIVAIYPSGTVNLLAMEGKYSADPRRFAHDLLSGSTVRPHYPVRIDADMFFACASAGPDVAAIERVSANAKRRVGRLAYLQAFCGVLWDWPRDRIELELDEERLVCGAFYIAKGRYFAGRWRLAPAARVGDPILHVVVLDTATRRQFARFALAMLVGADPAGVAGIRRLTCTSLSARSAGPTPVQADGDIVTRLPVTMSVETVPIRFR